MAHAKLYQSAIACIHAAIDYEHVNNYEDAYKKYAEGLTLIGNTLKDDAELLNQPQVANMHKQMLDFAKKSTDRLLVILEKIDNNENEDLRRNNSGSSAYKKLSNSLSEIVSETPNVSFHFPDEIPGIYSPLTAAEADNKRMIKMYEKRIESLLDSSAKANLQLELERRLAENDDIAKVRYEHWEKERKALAEECQRIAQEKFFIQEKIKTGVVKDTDITKQNLYAACLQYHKEHRWAQESSCKLLESIENENYIKKIISFFLQHGSHPLACVFRQLQQKALNKLSKLQINQIDSAKYEETILEGHFKNIVEDSKEDLFMLTVVMQALWDPLNTEEHQIILMDVLHHLYFPTIKPYFIQLLRITQHHQEEKISECMAEHNRRIIQYPRTLNGLINKLYQLSHMHSPSTMMILLIEILQSLINVHSGKGPNEELQPLSIGIDDIMPKLIQFILISNMSTLPAEITFVENFMPAKKALGQEGYAVTLFQSVLSYICDNSTMLSSTI